MTLEDMDFASVRPGALAGRYLRQYWQPVGISDELAPGRARRIRVVGNDYTLYRGEGGAAHLVADKCPHRHTSLAYGWVEEDCIRCRYHGWKFGADGRAVELPAENENFTRSVSIETWPTYEYLGLIFAFLGEGEPPEFRRFHELEDDRHGELSVHMWTLPYNFFQRVENDYDEVHVNFVHRDKGRNYGFPEIPQVKVEEREFGLLRTGNRNGRTRYSYGFMPNCFLTTTPNLVTKSQRQAHLAFRVPADDRTTLSFVINRGVLHRRTAAEPWERTVQRIMNGEMTLDDVDQDNPFLFVIQDSVALLAQGEIADRRGERLGQSDRGVMLLRQVWAREMTALAEGRPLTQWRHCPDLIASFSTTPAEG